MNTPNSPQLDKLAAELKAFAEAGSFDNRLAQRLDTSPENVSKGMVQLVLTLVELIRDVVEKQAIRRIEGGSLSEEEIERLGTTLMLLEEKMQEFKDFFGFTDEDLNLDLGPLGNLR